MPHKDPVKNRVYQREWARKRRAHPDIREAENARKMARIHEQLKDPAFRAERNALHRAQYHANRDNQRAAQKKRYEKLRQQFIAWRATLICVRCGSAQDIEFHHRSKHTKINNVTCLVPTPGAYKRELEKCDPLCRKCHKFHHSQERRRTIKPSGK